MSRSAARDAGASIQPYYLGGYSPARVRPGGNLTVLAASAAQAAGRLQATFRLLLAGSAAALAAQPLDVLSAASSLSETGALIPHRASQVRASRVAPWQIYVDVKSHNSTAFMAPTSTKVCQVQHCL